VIAYSHCIAHGIDMSHAMHHQREAVDCGYWPIYRFDPRIHGEEAHPFRLDSRPPSHSFAEFALQEGRFTSLAGSEPERAKHLLELAQEDIDERRHRHERMAGVERPAARSGNAEKHSLR
jgi:pyruvate-ferredoxin/flavodoxin oxidoreductase